jgi:hypothetical protein
LELELLAEGRSVFSSGRYNIMRNVYIIHGLGGGTHSQV